MTAFDLEFILVRRAALRRSVKYEDSIFFHVGDAQDLPFRDASFDAVVNFGIIHHLEDWGKGIGEIVRVLVPNGLFYFEEIYPPLYANFLFRRLVAHPTENRFYGEEFRAGLSAKGLRLRSGFKENRFGILGVAQKDDA